MPKQVKLSEDPEVRARNRAQEALAASYDAGNRVVSSYAWARDALELMKERAPHVPEETLVRSFAGKTQSHSELLVNHAYFLEYNAQQVAKAAAAAPAPRKRAEHAA